MKNARYTHDALGVLTVLALLSGTYGAPVIAWGIGALLPAPAEIVWSGAEENDVYSTARAEFSIVHDDARSEPEAAEPEAIRPIDTPTPVESAAVAQKTPVEAATEALAEPKELPAEPEGLAASLAPIAKPAPSALRLRTTPAIHAALAPKAPALTNPMPGHAPQGSCGEAIEGIKRTERGVFEVSRELVQSYTSSFKQLSALGWSRMFRDKETDVKGWQIGGFGCSSPLYKGGLRSRDVVRSINGHKTQNVGQLLGLWSSWKRQSTFEVVVWRNGREHVLRYTMI